MRALGLIAVVLIVLLLLYRSKGQMPQVAPAALPEPDTPAPAAIAQASNQLDNLMQAIFQMEGGKPGDRNVVNNNPGDLRSAQGQTGTAGGYATFADIGDGWDALSQWIASHTAAHPDWDFYDFFSRYLGGTGASPAPADQGNSDAYAEYVANYLGVDPTTPVSSVLGNG